MKTQKGFLIAITVLVCVGITIQLITMSKDKKRKEDIPGKKGYDIQLGELTQEVIE